MNLHVVRAVAGEPVELVHDAELHPARAGEAVEADGEVADGGHEVCGVAGAHL